jgi:hypothetical protein
MRAKAIIVVGVAALVGFSLGGCGGHSLPRTQANLSVCQVLEKVLTNQAPMIDLTEATLMTNAPITHQLRQDIATYIAMAVQNMSGAGQAADKAEADCKSIGG